MNAAMLVTLLLLGSAPTRAQFDRLPDSPLASNMGEATSDNGGTSNQLTSQDEFERKQEEQRHNEVLENRYDVPDEDEEKEFNANGTQNP